ncbi:MAG: DUF1810 domain-containing protein [Longicatena sp.]|nr:DUF1810 domain-containing protein [Longicatena sp.]
MNLERFINAQQYDYPVALYELKAGYKESHWMWFIFPQYKGLGYSSIAKYYAIQSKEEAIAYVHHPILGKRLMEISQVLLDLNCDDATAIFGSPDNLKLKSCMTLFYIVSKEAIFQQVLDQFYHGQYDQKTIELLEME